MVQAGAVGVACVTEAVEVEAPTLPVVSVVPAFGVSWFPGLVVTGGIFFLCSLTG